MVLSTTVEVSHPLTKSIMMAMVSSVVISTMEVGMEYLEYEEDQDDNDAALSQQLKYVMDGPINVVKIHLKME